MDEMEEKLKSFSAAVLKVAENERLEKLSKLEKEKDRRISEKENELLEEAYDDIQKSIARIRREHGERVLKVEMDLKKELIMQREHIIDSVFGDVEKRLCDFADSDKYEAWLLRRVKNAAAEVGKGKKEVYVTEKDIKFKKMLEENVDNITVICESDADDFIGGVKVINRDRNVSVNYSMKDMLGEKRASFLQECGLSIY